MYGRIVLAVSAALFGVVVLISHGSDGWHRLLAVVQIVTAVWTLVPQTARRATIALGAIYLIRSVATTPGILAAPGAYVSYGNFFEQFAVVCGAIAVTKPFVLGRIARLGFGLCTASFALAQMVYLSVTASLVPTWIPPNQMFWAIFTTIAFGFAAIAMLINLYARLAAQMTAAMLALFGAVVWLPHIVAHPATLGNWSEFAESYLIAGAAWIIADRA